MTDGIDAEAVDARLDIVRVAVGDVLGNSRIFGIEVYAVAGDLAVFAGPVVPVKALKIAGVVVVVRVVGLACRDLVHRVVGFCRLASLGVAYLGRIIYVLHQVQALLVLKLALLCPVFLR